MTKRKGSSPMKHKEEKSFEKMYTNILKISPAAAPEDTNSLEQPSIYHTVQTVTTYGAYEKPI